MEPKKTTAGRPVQFSANFHNQLVDTVKWVAQQRKLFGSGQTGMRSNATNVLVLNGASGSLPAFSALEISSRLGGPKDFIWLKSLNGEVPTDCTLPVAITQAPSKEGELVECVIAGATIARVRVDSLGDRFASPVPGETFLASNYEGGMFRILEPLTETGVQRLLVAYHYAVTQICDSGSSSGSESDSSFSDSVDSLCLRIPGVDMDSIPLVSASSADFVLGIKDGCLVKISLTQCPEDGGGNGGSGGSGGGGGGGSGSVGSDGGGGLF